MPILNVQAAVDDRIKTIRDFSAATGQIRAEIDISGGIDSAVMAGLLAKALGPENVTAVWQSIHSSTDAEYRADDVAVAFGLKLINYAASMDWNTIVRHVTEAMVEAGYNAEELAERAKNDPTIFGSFRSCFRAPVGRFANRLSGGGIRHGTGNEDEDRIIRFYQKGGDGEVDSNPLAMFSKGEIFQLAIGLGVPRSVLEARPSPDLWGQGDGHNDEDEIRNYLGLPSNSPPIYSYVDLDTGEYKNVGLLERAARWSDTNGNILFDSFVKDDRIEEIIDAAPSAPQFSDLDPDIVVTLLRSLRHAERVTRHKANPYIPTLGNRADMIAAGILTNKLPI